VVQDPTLNRDVLVLPDGSISFPFVGSLRVGGLTTGQVQGQIAAGLAPNFAVQPNVFVAVEQVFVAPPPGPPVPGPTIDIFIQGEVNAPGLVQVSPGTTLMQALSLHGGFTNFAATRRIQLRRVHPHTGQTSVVTLNYRAVSDGATLSNDPVLAEGDVILVPQRRLFE
jgi:polysaccharide export outer membrane protein